MNQATTKSGGKARFLVSLGTGSAISGKQNSKIKGPNDRAKMEKQSV
jgi:hypothetical protein